MTIFYAADLTYVTRAGTKLTAHHEFIDFTDVTVSIFVMGGLKDG